MGGGPELVSSKRSGPPVGGDALALGFAADIQRIEFKRETITFNKTITHIKCVAIYVTNTRITTLSFVLGLLQLVCDVATSNSEQVS